MILRITGGLCNQIFIYAAGRGLAARTGKSVKYQWRRSTWDWGLDKYHTEIELAEPSPNDPIYDEGTFGFDSKFFEQPENTYFRGYWQSENYFKDIASTIRKELTLKESVRPEVEAIAKELAYNAGSVFIHVRRGDYTNAGTAAFHGNLGMDYYEKAIAHVKQRINNPKFYLFSDDPSYCVRNFQFPVISTENFTAHEDLYLMSHAWHGIGANSTFSWFANWLGDYPQRVVVMPKNWFADPNIDTSTLVPERWSRI